MAGNRKVFERSMKKWEEFYKEGHFSAPIEVGKTAIVSSYFTDEAPDTITGVTELQSFRIEALALADRVRAVGRKPELAIDASRDDITRLIQDPDVANIYMIGNGSLSSLVLDVKDYYDWTDVSQASTHLKQGLFIQRQCGNLSRVLNVPLGLFAVTDARNVQAAFGEDFYPLSLDDAENDKIQPLFNTDRVDYALIKSLGSLGVPGPASPDLGGL